ncbi:hypothetical protein GGS23DRAFT_591041 [Durotheca rogersii]|uniref:uncharacterized protein n=1 Tax=Durotheca rogersii TaxID=419775 RepID=UPI002220E84F|nr:uncharacterized protein GGS23DRAFT_591041 [Durotheca rogersii]KAI5853677.1 hypothetical protein GGS23DRAFT_591041 [Durotheca rogersii]
MSRYDDDYSRRRPNHSRDRSDDFANSASGYDETPRVTRPEQTAYPNGLQLVPYDPDKLYFPPPPQQSSLDVPESQSRSRPRSLPPPIDYRSRSAREGTRTKSGRSTRGRRYSDDSGGSGSGSRAPIDRARDFVDNNFSGSAAGLGISVLGALVGGLAAREAVDATSRRNGHHTPDPNRERNRLIGTVVGAAVGALGANAVEKRFEVSRDKNRDRDRDWEQDRTAGEGSSSRHRRRRRQDSDLPERRSVVARPRSSSGGGGWRKDWDLWDDRDRGSGKSRGLEREADPEARSWKNVEEWLNDRRNDVGSRPQSSERRSVDGEYRY